MHAGTRRPILGLTVSEPYVEPFLQVSPMAWNNPTIATRFLFGIFVAAEALLPVSNIDRGSKQCQTSPEIWTVY